MISISRCNYDILSPQVIDGIVQVGMAAFGLGMLKQEILDHIFPTDKLYLSFKGSTISGFATAKLKAESVDLVGAAVHPDLQRRGTYLEFGLRRILFAYNAGRHTLELRIQNPRIEAGMKSCLEVLMNQGIVRGYKVERELRSGLYGRMLTAQRPLSGKKEIDQLYDALDYEKGDAFAFRFNMEVGI